MVLVRPMRHFDLEELEEVQNFVLGKNKTSQEILVELVRRRGTETTNDTRSCILEDDREEIVGGFIYELHPDAYEVLFHCVIPRQDALEEFAGHLKGLAHRSKKRKKIRLYLRDDDNSHLRVFHPFWTSQGFSSRLAAGHFHDCDGWEMTIDCTN